MMLVWTVTGFIEAGMDIYWIDDAGMDSSWID